MTEPLDRLSTAFTDLAASVLPEVNLPGPDTAHATVRRRRRRRIAVVAAVVAVVILAPATAVALLRDQVGTEPDIGNTPSPSATAAPQPRGLRVIGDANVRAPTPLDDALLPIPPFGGWTEGCPEGETQYADGTWRGSRLIPNPPTYVESSIYQVAVGDVNGDGTSDWVAAIGCEFGTIQDTRQGQIVAFTQDDDGGYALLGQVFLPEAGHGTSDPEIGVDGVVRYLVGGIFFGGPISYEWRSARWSGSEFVSAGPPTVIPTQLPTNLTLTVTPSTVSAPETVLSITVHNAGPAASEYLELSFTTVDTPASLSIRPEGFPADLQPRPPGCRSNCFWEVTLEPVPVGQSATGQFTVVVSDAHAGGRLALYLEGWVRGPYVPNATDQNSVTVPIAPG